MSEIKSIKAREILDSKGNPTVEVDLKTDLGLFRASVPSGVSKGKYEALELRDKEKRYGGKGVLKAVENINRILAPELLGKDPTTQIEIDELMIKIDGTENKSRLGANAILPLSIAVCRAGATAENLSLFYYLRETYSFLKQRKIGLPNPCLLLIEGGLHASGDLAIQEFMLVPEGDSFNSQMRIGTEIYHNLGQLVRKECQGRANVGVEGGFAVCFKKIRKVLDLISGIIEGSSYKGEIIIDAAATHFYENNLYRLEDESLDSRDFLDLYLKLIDEYSLLGIEDPFSENDWQGFKSLMEKKSRDIFVIGDDLLITNVKRIKRAAREKACNGLVLKPNQVGTITETVKAAQLAFDNGWEVFVKHRGGDTSDDFIADLAVGVGARYIMAGAPVRGERVAKYNRLLRIGEELAL